MSSRLSPPLADFADGRWPDEHGMEPRAFALRNIDIRDWESHDLEPPLHPSEMEPFERSRWSVDRRLPVAFIRFVAIFFIGVAATLSWQTYGNPARQMAAHWSPSLGWLAPPATTVAPAAPVVPAAYAAGPAASPGQLAAISHSLVVVRQNVDKIAADIARLQAAKQEPPGRTPGPPPTQSRRAVTASR